MGLLLTSSSSLLVVFLELFAAPVLKALPSSEPQEGGSVTLSCQTKLALQRSASRLLFSFYKDGRSLSVRGVSSELKIPKASEEHSGSYWCEAVTEDRQISKQSPQLEIWVQGELMCICTCGVCVRQDWVYQPNSGGTR
jgi:hypothetical protein